MILEGFRGFFFGFLKDFWRFKLMEDVGFLLVVKGTFGVHTPYIIPRVQKG